MGSSISFKHAFFNAFREFFVHHHGSLEFRAKVLALMIAANDNFPEDGYKLIFEIGEKIYPHDPSRASLLTISTKQKVNKMKQNSELDIDNLISSILKDLHFAPRYAKKINIEELEKIIQFTLDDDTLCYQKNILEFIEKMKHEILDKHKGNIDTYEENSKK